MAKPTTIDAYIADAEPEARPHLRAIRAILKEVAPKATEAIKWGSPIFEEKRILFAFSAHKSHINFMPTGSTLIHFQKELEGYVVGKFTVQFPFNKPLPKALIKKVARFRAVDVRENDARWM